jgi:hypothetical protein
MRLPLGPGHASPTFSTSIARPKRFLVLGLLAMGTGAAALAFSPLDERGLQPPGAARGSWGFDPEYLRSAIRIGNSTDDRGSIIGFGLPGRSAESGAYLAPCTPCELGRSPSFFGHFLPEAPSNGRYGMEMAFSPMVVAGTIATYDPP